MEMDALHSLDMEKQNSPMRRYYIPLAIIISLAILVGVVRPRHPLDYVRHFIASALAPPHYVTLTWKASTSKVVGYNVYRSTTSGGPYISLNTAAIVGTTFTDNNVKAGVTYFYVVTAVAANEVESVRTPEISATVPTP
jgi:hypothetical protein